LAQANILQSVSMDNAFLRLQAHLVPSYDCKGGAGCAFFLCHKTQGCSPLPAVHRMQHFSNIAGYLLVPKRLRQMKPPVLQQGTAHPRRTQVQHGFDIYEPPVSLGHLQAVHRPDAGSPLRPCLSTWGNLLPDRQCDASQRIGIDNADPARRGHAGPLARGTPTAASNGSN
jgi:hypothetical protein